MDVIFAYIDNAIPVNIHTPPQMSKFVWGSNSSLVIVQGWNIPQLPCPGLEHLLPSMSRGGWNMHGVCGWNMFGFHDQGWN